MGTQKKRERDKEIMKLSQKIQLLETLHKKSLSVQSATTLLETRKSLKQLLDSKSKRLLFFKKKVYYEQGDTSGHLLTRALKNITTKHNITGIQDIGGNIDRTTDKIAQHFQEFYTNLYNLPNQHRPPNLQGDR